MIQESLRDVLRNQCLSEAVEKYIKGFPKDTEIRPDGMQWSKWDGNLALVTGPSYSSSMFPASEKEFDPVLKHRRYCVRYALTVDRKKKVKAERSDVGLEPHIMDSRAQYEKTTWTMGTAGYGPTREGTFDKVFCVWVKIKDKDLYPGEVSAITKWMDEDNYYDCTNAKYKLKQSDWKKVFKMSFVKTQDLDSNIANAIDELVTQKSGRYVEDDEAERIWKDIGGVYKMSKKRDRLMFSIPK